MIVLLYNFFGDAMKFLITNGMGHSIEPNPKKIQKIMDSAFRVTVEQAAQEERNRFAERLKTLRNNAGLTQKQLAEKAGLVTSVIARYETGKAMAREKAILKLAAALNVPPDALDVTDSYSDYPALDLFDMKLLRKHGINARQIRPDFYAFSMPGCPEIKKSLKDCDRLCEYCFSETNKAFKEIMEDYFVNLFIRKAYAELEEQSTIEPSATAEKKK